MDDKQFQSVQDDAEQAALELNQKVTAIYGKMTLTERETTKRKAMRTLHRVQDAYDKLKTSLTNPDVFLTKEPELNSDEEVEQLGDTGKTTDDVTEDDEGLSIKKVIRWWKTCLNLVQQLLREDFGLMFDNIRAFLLEFNSQQATIQNTIDSLYVQEEVPHRLALCQKRLQRLQETVNRKSRLAYKAKANLEKEMLGLQGFENDPRVRHFLEEVSPIFLRFETEFPAELAKEDEKKAQKLQKIAQLHTTTQQEIQLLNRQLDACIRQAKAQTEEAILNAKT